MTDPYFLNETNPEIMRATPRGGGRAKLLQEQTSPVKSSTSTVDTRRKTSIPTKSPSRSSRRKSNVSFKDQPTAPKTGLGKMFESARRLSSVATEPVPLDMNSYSRECRIRQVLASMPWTDEMDRLLDEENREEMPNPLQDSIDMLAISISTIMLLAAGYDKVPDNHMRWTLSYLECIKSEFDEYPPNIQGILNHIEKQSGGAIKSFNEWTSEGNDELQPSPSVQIPPDAPAAPEAPPEAPMAE